MLRKLQANTPGGMILTAAWDFFEGGRGIQHWG